MSIQLLMGKNGTVKESIANGVTFVVQAKPGETYKIIDTETGKTPAHLTAKRTANTLSITDEDTHVTVELEGFWSNCATGHTQCFATFDMSATSSVATGESVLTQVQETLPSLASGQVGTLLPNSAITNATGLLAAAGAIPSAVDFAIGAGIVGMVIHKEELGSFFSRVIEPSAPPLMVNITQVTTDSAGKIVVSGITDYPNLPVTITIPGNIPVTVVADKNGNFTTPVSSIAPPSGTISAVVINQAGNKATDTAPYVDVTPPAVTIDSITFNPNETSVITGHTEPNTPVTLTLPDGTTLQTTSNAAGVFGPVTTTAIEPAGNVVAAATDAAGNVGHATDALRRLSPTDLTDWSEESAEGRPIDDITSRPTKVKSSFNNFEYYTAASDFLLTFVTPADSKPQAGETLHMFVRQAPLGETQPAPETHSADKKEVASSYSYNAVTNANEFTITDKNVFTPSDPENFAKYANGYYYISYEYTNAAGAVVAQSSEYRMGIEPYIKPDVILPLMTAPNYVNGTVDTIKIDYTDANNYGTQLDSKSLLLDRSYLVQLDANDIVNLVNDTNAVWTANKEIVKRMSNTGYISYESYHNSASQTDVLIPLAYINNVHIV